MKSQGLSRDALQCYTPLSPMFCRLLPDSCQMAIKPALVVYFGNLFGEDFVAKLLALTSSYWLQIKIISSSV